MRGGSESRWKVKSHEDGDMKLRGTTALMLKENSHT
jgi:hypothetical protein